jgi:hypothetical protein
MSLLKESAETSVYILGCQNSLAKQSNDHHHVSELDG